MPKPKPRHVKTPETQLTSPLDQIDVEKVEEISPAKEHTLDIETVQVGISPSDTTIETYEDRKKFWETVSRESEITISKKKRMSLFEEPTDTEKQLLAKKRTSVHEISGFPPIPKPRSTLQTSVSLSESEGPGRQQSISSVDESTGSIGQTELTRISESDKSLDEALGKPMTEYQAAYQVPQPVDGKTKTRSEELKGELQKTDSLDSEKDYSSQAYENAGYISDSGDVEHYISDSEIEDRVPQIRERQMSIAVPVAPARKSIYERSASLPTEDLYEVSARSVKLRKQYYEQQIKKEMIVEQLTSEVEEEPSPERKTLTGLTIREEESPIGTRSAPEKLSEEDEQYIPATIKDIAKSFEEAKITDVSSSVKSFEQKSTDITRSDSRESGSGVDAAPVKPPSVRDLAKGFEKELGSVVAGHKIGQPSKDMKGFVLEKHTKGASEKVDVKDIKDFQEIVHTTHKPDSTVASHKNGEAIPGSLMDTMESVETAVSTHKFETHKSFESTTRTKRSSTESEQSISSERSMDFGAVDEVIPTYREDSMSKPSDSMEVHVDKSEIEDSEKVTDIEQDATDLETKSLDSLNAVDDHVPEITVTLSGKQRRISEDSDEESEKETHKAQICQSEQRSEDVVWEVSVESEPNIKFDERAYEISAEEPAKVEKDEDLSGSVRDESDLGSEIHQDHSDSYASDKIKSETHSEMEKIILESLHQQKVDPEEAKKIATALIEDIEAEIERRQPSGIVILDMPSDTDKPPISDYLRQLAEAKGLDEREVELVESVLARRERELARLSRRDTEASSMEITDEDLRYSGTEVDYNNILEQQMDQLEHEKSVEDIKAVYDTLEKECRKDYETQSVKSEKTEDESVKESSIQRDYETYEEGKITARKMDIQSKTSDSMKSERRLSEKRDAILEEDETALDSITEETEIMERKIETSITHAESKKTDSVSEALTSASYVTDKTKHAIDTVHKVIEATTKDSESKIDKTATSELEQTKLAGKYALELETEEKFDEGFKKSKIEQDQEVEKMSGTETKTDVVKIEETKRTDEGQVEILQTNERTHTKTESSLTHIDHKHEVSTAVTSKVLGEVIETDLEKLIASGTLNVDKEKLDQIKPIGTDEIVIIEHEQIKRTYSDESKSSQDESIRSPEEQFSTCSSGRKGDSDSVFKAQQKQSVTLRKTKSQKDADTSSSSGKDMKVDRKSGIDFEAYSSSGESHYHSFEVDSGRSRPCSSDVEGLVAAGSSEYESALTSQDISAPSHMTDYHTAVSSLSSKESMKSLDSESSGNLASVEVSEASETLVPSTFEVDRDILDESVDEWHEKPVRQSTSDSDYILGSIDASEETELPPLDSLSKMKRSHEMTFQPEPKVLAPDSPHDADEKFGTSLDEGSVLSMSVSSTSSASALRTVIELSRTDSERLEGSMTISGSFDDVEAFQGSRESLIHTPTRQTDMSTSTPSQPSDFAIGSVTITTSTVAEDGLQNVSTQVTSEVQTPEKDLIEDVVEPKKKGHRRQESAAFAPSMFSMASRSEIEQKIHSDLAESDKYTSELSYKEVISDEKKDVDETEKDEFYETEADQGFHRDMREGRYLETESDVDGDSKLSDVSRPQSQISKSGFSDDKPDSELMELAKLTSSDGVTEPVERPISPEPPEDYEIKDDTPELSSEAQASVGELEQEYTSAIARAADFHLPDIKKVSEKATKDLSSEKSSFEEAEAEAAFSMVAHVSPAHKVKQICPILEDDDAEKHELETRERAKKELEKKRKAQMKDLSPGFIPDIKITQHMAPLVDHGFHYPDLEYEQKEREKEESEKPEAPQTPSSKSSEDTDQGREYTLEDSGVSIPEEPEGTFLDEKAEMTESKSELGTVVEKTIYESDKETSRSGSSNSDSFEMLEKPDLIDDFVVIEEVAKEAQEFDTEGKSVKITMKKKAVKKADAEIEEYLTKSAPTTTTAKMTDMKYYPDGSSSDELGFEFEDSPPQLQKQESSTSKKGRDYVYEYDRELEANRKWIEQQFQGDQAAMMAAGYGYEMEFERGPLEDIKEEDINDFDPTSSRIGSVGSQKESGGSLGSVKDSFSSTPEYDVLAGRKYFTRSGEHDDVSMSSLQEFENLERAMSLEQRKYHQGSQDSLSNGSFGRRYYASRSGQGDDVSVSSLKEFEGLEKACIDAHKIEVKVKEEEAMLAQIDEGQESIASEETESCETMSGTDKKVIPDSDEEDYEKRMFEIDEIIRQAQTNVERFVDLKECEKTESLGRGDSFEEVAKVPELELDVPEQKASSTKVQWADTSEDVMAVSTDSLDLPREEVDRRDSTDSLDQKTTAGDIMTASTDSIELQAAQKAKDTIMTDSIEVRDEDEKSNMVASDSLELATGTSANVAGYSDSIDEDGGRVGVYEHSTSSEKDGACLPKDNELRTRAEHMLGSTDSLDPSSSAATHATYQYETDSVFSGSFTSGGSNTMVSSTDTIEQREGVDLAAAVRKVWFDDATSGTSRTFTTEYFEDDSRPYVTEVIEPCEETEFSHTIHRRVEMPPEIRKVTFSGADAEEQMRRFMEEFGEGEDVQESEEVDKDGNVHVKRIVQKRLIIKDGSEGKPDVPGHGVIKRTYTDGQHSKTIYTQEFDLPQGDTTSAVRDILTSIAGDTGSSRFPSEVVVIQINFSLVLYYLYTCTLFLVSFRFSFLSVCMVLHLHVVYCLR